MDVLRGTSARAQMPSELHDVLRDQYGITDLIGTRDLGGSSNLNLLVDTATDRYVVRIYRPWVTTRLDAIQLARRTLESGGVPSAPLVSTREGRGWIALNERLVEVERFVDHDEDMDSWERLERGLPWLGRVHTLLQPLALDPAGRVAPPHNNIELSDVLTRS